MPVDLNESNDYTVEYNISSQKLRRLLLDSSNLTVSETHIADFIDMTNTSFVVVSENTSFHHLTISAKKEDKIVTKTYSISQRL
jgi:hypothetical protein